MPAGRPPAGPRIVEKLEGEDEAKARLTAILETVAGESTVDAACGKLEICPARFYRIRDRALQAALARLEPQPGGRPRKQVSPEEERIQELEEEVQRLKRELTVAEVRAQTALLLPRRPEEGTAAGKKTPHRSKRSRRRRRAPSRR